MARSGDAVAADGRARRCPICGRPARVERVEMVVHVARWAEGLPHVGQRLRCTSVPPHTWEVQS